MGYILVINIDFQILSKILFRFKNDKILKISSSFFDDQDGFSVL